MAKFPSNLEIDGKIADLHQSPWLLYAATTGAAGGLREDLWRTPGSSNTILGMQFLYDRHELEEFIRRKPEQYCSRETAAYMAAAAYAKGRRRAVENGLANRPVIGVGMTAAVNRGDRNPMKGEHRAHIVIKTADDCRSVSAVFEKGKLTREEEGRACDLLTLAVILERTIGRTFGLDVSLGISSKEFGGICIGSSSFVSARRLPDEAEPCKPSPETHLIYPGSFAPLHYGHEQVAEMAETMTGKKVIFQLTAKHPTKGEIPEPELAARMRQFSHRWPALILKNEGLYIEKARALPGYGFLIGADAVLGLLDPKYYGGRQGLMAILKEFNDLGTRFYVVGRMVDGAYLALEDIPVPERYRHLFQAVSGRWDVSSSEIRKA